MRKPNYDFCYQFLNDYWDKFTTQNKEINIKDIVNYIIDGNSSFVKENPEIDHMMRIIKYVILYHLQKDSNKDKHCSESKEIIYNVIYSDIVEQILNEFTIFFPHLDIDHIIALSGAVHESEETKDLAIMVVPSETWLKKQYGSICFSTNSRIEIRNSNINSIRKQLNLSKDGKLAIYYDSDNRIYKTLGIFISNDKPKYPYINFIKHMEWCFFIPQKDREEKTLFRYVNGTYMLPYFSIGIQVQKVIDKLFPHHEEFTERFMEIISKRNICNHGAVFIISSDEILTSEKERLFEKNRGLLLDPPQSLKIDEEILKSFIKKVSSIDGATFINITNEECLACGVILDGEVINNGHKGRGSRFNSTKTYIENLEKRYPSKPSIGIVLSEDGMIDIFSTTMDIKL